MHKLIIALIAILIWSIPAHTASALWQENTEESIFINYKQFHKTENRVDNPEQGDSQVRKSPVKKDKSTGSYSGRHHPAYQSDPSEYTGYKYSKEEVQELIISYSAQYGIDPSTPLCIARLESGFNQFSKNRSSTASGVFQYLSGTWKGTDEGKAGLSVFDAESNVKAAVKYMAIHKNTRPWVVANRCPSLKFLQ